VIVGRPYPTVESSPELFPKKMKVCVLTELQARLFEHKGVVPECSCLNRLRVKAGLSASDKMGGHLHMELRDARRHVGLDEGDHNARWVIGTYAIAFNTKRGWNNVRGSMQMTRETSGFRHAGGTHGPIPALGAHGRNLSVRDVNDPECHCHEL